MKKVILLGLLVAGMAVGIVLLTVRIGKDRDPDKILQITRAGYQEGVVIVDFDIHGDRLKRAVERNATLGQWRPDSKGDEWREELSGYALKIRLPHPTEAERWFGSVSLELPHEIQGIHHGSVPLLFPELYQEWSAEQGNHRKYSVEVTLVLVMAGEHRDAETGKINRYQRGADAAYQKQEISRPPVFLISDLVVINKQEAIDQSRGATVKLGEYGMLYVPADALVKSCAVDVTATVTLRGIDYSFSFDLPDGAGINPQKSIQLVIPYKFLGNWSDLRLLGPDNRLVSIQASWVNEMAKTVMLPITNAWGSYSLLAGVRE